MVVSQRSCRGINARGEACRAAPLHDSAYCRLHDPEQAAAVQEARQLGGLRRRKETTVSLAYDFDGLESVPQIRRLVEVAVYDTLSQENSIPRSRTLAYLAQIAAKLLEVGEME